MESHGNSSIIIGCVYRPPSTNNDSINSFNSVFYDILQIIDRGKTKNILIAGDYNLDLLKQDPLLTAHRPTADFINNLLSFSFLPAIIYPTHIADFSSTLIDNIFLKCSTSEFDSVIIYNDISDHLPVAVHLSNFTHNYSG